MKAARGTGMALVVIGIVFLASASRAQSTIGTVAGVMLALAGLIRLLRARAEPRGRE